MYFGSDNQTGASEQVFSFLQQANEGICAAYSDDDWTGRAVNKIQEIFECDAEVFLVSTGTAANSMALACMTESWDSIVCHSQSHIINDELTAPEFFTGGARLIGLDKQLPKLTYESLDEFLSHGSVHPPHNAIPKALSLTQMNESGQVYSIDEIVSMTRLAHDKGLTVHMDGARFANAVAVLGCTPAELSWKAGIDVLTLGATKNGALCAEAAVFFNKKLSSNFIQYRKRSGHLISKGRWLGAQFVGWLEDNHWLDLAKHANDMSARLATGVEQSHNAKLVWPVMGNEVFVLLDKERINYLRDKGAVFYEWPQSFLAPELNVSEDQDIVRLVTSFQTSTDEVDSFLELLNR